MRLTKKLCAFVQQMITQFQATSFFICPLKTYCLFMFSGGIQKDQ